MISPIIEERLKSYPEDVVQLATKAIELSDNMRTEAVVEALHQFIRQVVRNRGEHDTP